MHFTTIAFFILTILLAAGDTEAQSWDPNSGLCDTKAHWFNHFQNSLESGVWLPGLQYRLYFILAV